MTIRFTRNVALNARPEMRRTVTDFYRALGLDAKSIAPALDAIGPAPYGSLLVVSWDPPPLAAGELCVQMESDDLDAVRDSVAAGGGSIVFFGDDPNAEGKRHLWFRDPVGVLVNVIELAE